MDRAKELMKDDENKLEAISFEVGYDDYNYFSRVFRRFEGVSPSEYRKKQVGC
jgi:YesN/AraC family two-component response regulator